MTIPKKIEHRMALLRAENHEILSPQPDVHRRATEALLTHLSPEAVLTMSDDSLTLVQRHLEQGVAAGMTDEELRKFVLTFRWSPSGAYTPHAEWLRTQREPEPRNNVVQFNASRTG